MVPYPPPPSQMTGEKRVMRPTDGARFATLDDYRDRVMGGTKRTVRETPGKAAAPLIPLDAAAGGFRPDPIPVLDYLSAEETQEGRALGLTDEPSVRPDVAAWVATTVVLDTLAVARSLPDGAPEIQVGLITVEIVLADDIWDHDDIRDRAIMWRILELDCLCLGCWHFRVQKQAVYTVSKIWIIMWPKWLQT